MRTALGVELGNREYGRENSLDILCSLFCILLSVFHLVVKTFTPKNVLSGYTLAMSGEHKTTLWAINQTLAEGVSSRGVFEAIIYEAVELCGAERGFLIVGADELAASAYAEVADYSSKIVKFVRDSKEPVLSLGVEGDASLSQTAFAQHSRSVMAVPLTVSGQVIGVVYLDLTERGRTFTEADLTRLSALADQAVLAFRLALMRRDIDQQSAAAAAGHNHDGLTELANRRGLDAHLRQLLSASANLPLSLLLLKVDHFEVYEERNGAPAGNELLKRLALILSSSLRGPDVAAHPARGKFALVLPRTEKDNAGRVAERLRLVISKTDFPFGSSQPGGAVRVSVGIASAPHDGSTAEKLLGAAQRSLEAAL